MVCNPNMEGLLFFGALHVLSIELNTVYEDSLSPTYPSIHALGSVLFLSPVTDVKVEAPTHIQQLLLFLDVTSP